MSSPWLYDANGKQVTPLLDGLPTEEGHPKENNAKRFMKKREGLHVVLVPIETPEAFQSRGGEDGTSIGQRNGLITGG
jgi:hypothetical protein